MLDSEVGGRWKQNTWVMRDKWFSHLSSKEKGTGHNFFSGITPNERFENVQNLQKHIGTLEYLSWCSFCWKLHQMQCHYENSEPAQFPFYNPDLFYWSGFLAIVLHYLQFSWLMKWSAIFKSVGKDRTKFRQLCVLTKPLWSIPLVFLWAWLTAWQSSYCQQLDIQVPYLLHRPRGTRLTTTSLWMVVGWASRTPSAVLFLFLFCNLLSLPNFLKFLFTGTIMTRPNEVGALSPDQTKTWVN